MCHIECIGLVRCTMLGSIVVFKFSSIVPGCDLGCVLVICQEGVFLRFVLRGLFMNFDLIKRFEVRGRKQEVINQLTAAGTIPPYVHSIRLSSIESHCPFWDQSSYRT